MSRGKGRALDLAGPVAGAEPWEMSDKGVDADGRRFYIRNDEDARARTGSVFGGLVMAG